MANRTSGRSPSRTFIGAVAGIASFVLVPMGVDHPSEIELITRLLLFAGLGMAVGAIAETRRARRARQSS